MAQWPLILGGILFPSGSGYYALAGGAGSTALLATEDFAQAKWYHSATLSKLWVKSNVNTRDGDLVITLRKNGADTGLAVTVPAGTTGVFEDTSDSVSLADGDLVCYHFSLGGSSGSVQLGAVRVLEDCPSDRATLITSGEEAMGALVVHTLSAGGRTHSASPATLSDFYSQSAITFDKLRVVLSQNSMSASTPFRTEVNGVNGNLDTSIPATTTGAFEDASDSDALAAGDAIRYELDGSGSSIGGTVTPSLVQIRSNQRLLHLISGWHRFQNSNLTIYPEINGWLNNFAAFGASTETNMQVALGVVTKLSHFEVNVYDNTLNGDSTAALRVNGADTGLVVTIPAGVSGRFLVAGEVAVDADDLVNFRMSTGGSSGSVGINYLAVEVGQPLPMGGAWPRWRSAVGRRKDPPLAKASVVEEGVVTAAATLVGGSSLQAVAVQVAVADVVCVGRGSADVEAVSVVDTASALMGQGSQEATGTVVLDSVASALGWGHLGVVGQPVVDTATFLTGQGAQQSVATRVVEGDASIIGWGATDVAALPMVEAGSSLLGMGASAPSAQRVALAATTLTGQGSLLADTAGLTFVTVGAALSGSGTSTVAAVSVRVAQAALTGSGVVGATGVVVRPVTSSLVGRGAANAAVIRVVPSFSALSGIGQTSSDAAVVVVITVDADAGLQGRGSLDAQVGVISEAVAVLSGQGRSITTAFGTLGIVTVLIGGGNLHSNAQLRANAVASLVGFGFLSVSEGIPVVPIDVYTGNTDWTLLYDNASSLSPSVIPSEALEVLVPSAIPSEAPEVLTPTVGVPPGTADWTL